MLSLLLLLTLSSCQPHSEGEATPPAASTPIVEASSPAPAETSSPVARTSTLQEGQEAPAPAALDQDGKEVDFGKLYSKGTVLVYFYPKAGTPGCTAQACSLRDAYQDLTDRGVTVVGVSTDSTTQQKKFQAENHLPFTLIPDPEGKVIEAFGVPRVLGVANREAFLIRDGKVIWHDNSASTSKQAQDVLEILKSS